MRWLVLTLVFVMGACCVRQPPPSPRTTQTVYRPQYASRCCH